MRRRHYILGTAAAVSLLSTGVCAQVCDDDAKSVTGRAWKLRYAIERLDKHVGMIEGVPDSEAKFIDREREAALVQGNSARYQLVRSNKYYHALQVHNEFKVLRENIVAAQNANSAKQQAIFLTVVLNRFGAFREAFSEYINFDSKRSPSVFVHLPEAVSNLSFDSTVAQANVLTSLQCAIHELRN